MVISLRIGQSAGKKPKFVMTRIWFSLNDSTGMGLIETSHFWGLRYSLALSEN